MEYQINIFYLFVFLSNQNNSTYVDYPTQNLDIWYNFQKRSFWFYLSIEGDYNPQRGNTWYHFLILSRNIILGVSEKCRNGATHPSHERLVFRTEIHGFFWGSSILGKPPFDGKICLSNQEYGILDIPRFIVD